MKISNEIKKQAVDSLKSLIDQPSYLSAKEPNAPWGNGINSALDVAMSICDNLGYNTFKDPNGYYGYADIGEGDELFGIICHLDVVPANAAEWNTNPFHAVVKDNIIYGRGAQDDKGPTIAAIFAVKELLNQGIKFNKKIRFIFETDEETLWRGINKYKEKEKSIDMGIVPDAEFPLIYAEKGLDQAYLVGPGSDQLNINLDNSFNVVPDKAVYSGPKLDEVQKALDKLNFEYKKSNNQLIVLGKAVHSMKAPEGTNAVLRLAMALDSVFNIPILNFIGQCFKEDATGANVLGNIQDDVSGHLTFNISSLQINNKESRIKIDLRIPVKVDHDELIKKLNDAVKKYNLHYEKFDYVAPLYVPKDSKLVKTLMKIYKENTGDDAKPTVSGGATEARAFSNCVAFGGMLPGTKDLMHQANEAWKIDDLYKDISIYAEAIKTLCSLQ